MGRALSSNVEALRTNMLLNDNTGTIEIIFYRKEEAIDSEALKNYEFM